MDSMNVTESLIASLDTSTANYDEYDNWPEGGGVCRYERHSALFLPVLYSLCFVIGLIGNALVFWVILARLQLQSMTDICLLNLAIVDLLLLCALPFLAHYSRADWVFGDVMCRIILGSYYIGFYSGIFFVTLMSVDRYLAIVHAVYALKARTRTYGLLANTVIWIIGIFAAFPEISYISLNSHHNSTLCSVDFKMEIHLRKFSILKMNVLGLLIPLGIMLFCYSMIIRKLLQSKSTKSKTIHLVLSVVMVFFCCWVPYNIASFFKVLELFEVSMTCDSSKGIRLSLQIMEALAYSHTCWNPILYVFVGQKFRGHLLNLIKTTFGITHPSFITVTPSLSSQFSKTEEISSHM